MAKENFNRLKAVENIQLNPDGSILIKLNSEKQLSPIVQNDNILLEKDQISQSEVATLFRVTVQTIINWSNKGIIRRYKLGNRVFYLKSEIIDAAKSNHQVTRL